MRRPPQNIALLVIGISIALMGTAFPPMAGSVFRNGAPVVLAVFLIGKGASTLQCRPSDVVLGAGMFVFTLLSKVAPTRIVSPVVFHLAALLLLPIFAMTGLTLRAIARDRKSKNWKSGSDEKS